MNRKVTIFFAVSGIFLFIFIPFLFGQYEQYKKDSELRQACEKADKLVKEFKNRAEKVLASKERENLPSGMESFGAISLIMFSRSEECQRVR
jgi:hypothetical protein